jgi:hypothetical protein
MALLASDRPAALDALGRALQPQPGQERDDPLWRYHVVQGRDVARWFEQLHRSVVAQR